MGTLDGRRLLVTRRPEQSGELVARLIERGARVVELPTLAIVPPEDCGAFDAAVRGLDAYDWLVLTSANTAAAVRDRLAASGIVRAAGARPRGASVGPVTTAAAREALPWLRVVLEPEADYRAEGLARAFEAHDVAGRRLLVPLSDRARDTLAVALRARGAVVDAPLAYRTVAPPGLRERFEAALATGLDLLLFASPSAVDNLRAAAPELLAGLPAAVIGPVTEEAARAAGLEVLVVAAPSTVEGLLAALDAVFGL
jgi:uroporphyrinogen III methyltransferase/synthase